MANLNKQINELIANRPQYEISPVVGEDQAVADANAFGTDRVLAGEQNRLAQDTATNINTAQQYSGSANSILATLASITGKQYAESRNLGIGGAQLRNEKIGQKFAVDRNAEDAYDKAFNWNVAGRYSDMLNMLYQKKRVKDARVNTAIQGVTTAGGLLGKYGDPGGGVDQGNSGGGGGDSGGGASKVGMLADVIA